MRLCDYVSQRLVEEGVKNIYGIMGGGAAGLNDGFIKNKNLRYICFHHEQGASNAAIAESKITNNISVVNPTTGCGGLNCITSLVSAFQDSLPLLFISGNYKLSETSRYLNQTQNLHLRKFGVQEADIIEHVKYSTKFYDFITTPEQIYDSLEEAIYQCKNGRQGPCWIDIPSNFQTFNIEEKSFERKKLETQNYVDLNQLYSYLKYSQQPLIIAGYGLFLSNSGSDFLSFVEKNKIPFVTTYLTKDLIDYHHPLNIGTFGIRGNRSANFAIQTCDLLISMGCSMTSTHVGYDKNLFAPQAKKVMINIDENDYLKNNVNIDHFINCDLKDFFKNVK